MIHAFDIETEKWDRFVVGGLLSEDDSYLDCEWDKEEEFAGTILHDLEGEVWGHNAGRYDTLWLCDWIRKFKLKATVFATSARVTLVKVGRIEIRDSSAIAPLPLSTAAKIGGYEKLETGLPCTEDSRCSFYLRNRKPCSYGYCAIYRGMPANDMAKLKTYLRGDCFATLYGVVKGLRSYASENAIEIKGTIGASSWATAKNELSLPPAKWNPPRLYAFTRRGYYGGRVQVFRPYSRRGKRWDINSAYIAALTTTNLPVGDYYEETSIQAKDSYHSGKEGIFTCRVKVEPQHVPPLPWRDSQERVWFPHGTFWGHWTGLELRYAVANCRTSILSFGPSIVWSDSSPILAPWAQRVWDLRHKAGKGTAIGKWLKWFGNSLTGKFAQRPETDVCTMQSEPPPGCPATFVCGGVLCNFTERCCPHRCTGKCGVLSPVGRDSGVWRREVYRIAENAHVQWAAYLTARARTVLHNQLVSDGDNGKSAVYCDTDSCYAERENAVNVGTDLGQFLYEGTYNEFRAFAPKTYSFIDQDGKRVIKAKGIPDPDWYAMLTGQQQTVDTGVNQFRSAIRGAAKHEGKVFQRRDAHRTVSLDRFGDRQLSPGMQYTKAVDFDEILSIVR